MFTSLFQLEQKPVTVFSASDAGAPTLTADIGSLKTLLKACLVTGYGSKQGLGWQMAFESTDKNVAAFKSADPTASGFYFKIDNSTTGSAKLSAYQTMTDINTAQKPIAIDNQYKLYQSGWKLIGHSKAFILLLNIPNYYSVIYASPIIFGDLPKEKKRVEPICLLWSSKNTASEPGGLQDTLFNNYDGTSSSVQCYPFRVNNNGLTSNLNKNYCRFRENIIAGVGVLFEPVLSAMPDSTWTFLPMLQPLSAPLNDVSNLGLINVNALKVVTGGYNNTVKNQDCVVPLDWWYA